MLSIKEIGEARQRAVEYFNKAGIVLTEEEKANLEVSDFGLGDLMNTGIELVVYVNTERCCSKEIILFPYQTCPEHRHPPMGSNPGKEETFRCRWGTVYLYVEGEPAKNPVAKPPKGRERNYAVWHEIILKPGMQYALHPNTLHWFQGGPEGAVVSEFSTLSRDELDIFTDEEIKRITEVKE